jgi:hypothetical protein
MQSKLPFTRVSTTSNKSGTEAAALQTLTRDTMALVIREAFGLRAIYRRFSERGLVRWNIAA